MKRDYEVSAALWQCGCADGAGSPIACVEWARDLTLGRGVTRDQVRGRVILQAACAHGDRFACDLSMSARAGLPKETIQSALTRTDEACGMGDRHACATQALHLEESIAVARPVCLAGVFDGCALLGRLADRQLGEKYSHCFTKDRTKEEALACLHEFDRTHQEQRMALRADRDLATEQLSALCKGGDLTACQSGEFIPAACEAHDWAACAELTTYEPGPIAGACDHGIGAACRRVALEARDGASVDVVSAKRELERACTLGDRRSCEDAEDPDLGAGCRALTELPTPRAQITSVRGAVAGGQPEEHALVGATLTVAWASWASRLDATAIVAFAERVGLPLVALSPDPLRDSPPPSDRVTFLTDPPEGDEILGPQIRALGIEALPELLVIDGSGHVTLRVVALTLGENHVRCVVKTLAR